MRYCYFLFLLFIATKSQCQKNSTGAIIYLKEKGVVVYIDSTKITPSKSIQPFSAGTHTLKAWAPGYLLLEDTFTISEGKIRFITPHLQYTPQYRHYKDMKSLRTIIVAIPVGLTALSAGIFYTRYALKNPDIDRAHSDALILKEKYEQSFSPSEFETNRTAYYNQVDRYKNLITKQDQIKKQGMAVTAAFSAAALSVITWAIITKKSKFSDRILLSRINPMLDPIKKQICFRVSI